MQPNLELIAINNNLSLIEQLLSELILQPRINALKWSQITQQTANIKIGYPSQHLASLITGILGKKTGARGDDLADGTEVKSCSRIDQLDKCNDCKFPIARIETECPQCGSKNIQRNNDSKWLFTIRSEDDLLLLTGQVPRILLIIGDYPHFDSGDYQTLRFQSFEIWTNSQRHQRFKELMKNYYDNIYLTHKKNNANKVPAPKNFWPYSYQFYLCNPILTFSCLVHNASNINMQIEFQTYIKPDADRLNISSVLMPINILKKSEKAIIMDCLNIKKEEDLPEYIDEKIREYLPLRDTDKGFTVATPYQRSK
jgi:predicted RNA-binding Zn-ribbon protein involved in translation (DUF1610 family)